MSWISCIAIALVLSITVDQTWSFACTQAGLPGVYRPTATVTATGIYIILRMDVYQKCFNECDLINFCTNHL